MALWYGVYFSNQVWAVQIDPIKPTLKAPGTQRLKLQYDRQS